MFAAVRSKVTRPVELGRAPIVHQSLPKPGDRRVAGRREAKRGFSGLTKRLAARDAVPRPSGQLARFYSSFGPAVSGLLSTGRSISHAMRKQHSATSTEAPAMISA